MNGQGSRNIKLDENEKEFEARVEGVYWPEQGKPSSSALILNKILKREIGMWCTIGC